MPSDDEPSAKDQYKRAAELEEAADKAQKVADDMKEDSRKANPRAKGVEKAAEELEKTAEVVEAEADDKTRTE